MALEQSSLSNSFEPERAFFLYPRKFFIIGNPDRPGVKEAAEDIKNQLNITPITEKPNSFKFVSSAKSNAEIYHNLVEAGINNYGDDQRALIGIGGDGGQSDYLETARTYFTDLTCLLTNKIGTARDLYWNLSNKNKNQNPTELYPLEFTIGDNDNLRHAVYNVGSFGRLAILAERINSLPRSASSCLQIMRSSRVVARGIHDSKTFKVTTADGTIHHVNDLVLTNSRRFGIIFHSRENSIDDPIAGVHLLKNTPSLIGKIILSAANLYEFRPERYINQDDKIKYDLEGESMYFQRDGESMELPTKTNVSIEIAKKPVRALTI